MKVEQMEDCLKIENGNTETFMDSDGITIKIKEEKNITLIDLEQKAIEYLYNKFEKNLTINDVDVKLFEILKKD